VELPSPDAGPRLIDQAAGDRLAAG
jgi:hypothetical protein